MPGDRSRQASTPRLRVLTFNLWHGGDAGGLPLEQSARLIGAARADVVGLQETHGLPAAISRDGRGRQADGTHELQIDAPRPDRARQLAGLLGWNFIDQGEKRAVISPYPILESTPGRWGVRLSHPSGLSFFLFNAHLMYRPYQPYQILRIPYEDAPFLETEAQVIEAARQARAEQVEALIRDMQPALRSASPVFLTGDFNEPSHLDWSEAAARAGRCPIKVEFPTTHRLAGAGLVDVYRHFHPDPVGSPGCTWTPTRAESDPLDHPDRLDFIFLGGAGAVPRQIEIVGEDRAHADLVVDPYPSDHRAVVATFELTGG